MLLPKKVCSSPGCIDTTSIKGLCRIHYQHEWYLKNRERVLLRQNKRYQVKSEEIGQKAAKYYQQNKEVLTEKSRRNSRRPGTRFRAAISAAKRRNLEWALQKDFFICQISLPCFYCLGQVSQTGVGLDRIDHQLGYLPDNVLPCCTNCNSLRNDKLTVEETQSVISRLYDFRNALLGELWRK